METLTNPKAGFEAFNEECKELAVGIQKTLKIYRGKGLKSPMTGKDMMELLNYLPEARNELANAFETISEIFDELVEIRMALDNLKDEKKDANTV